MTQQVVFDLKEIAEAEGFTIIECEGGTIRSGSTNKSKPTPRHICLTAKLSWVLGYYTAEGSTNKYSVSFAMHSKELKTYGRILKKYVKEIFSMEYYWEKPRENLVRVAIHSSIVAPFFRFVCPGIAHEKKIPGFILSASYYIQKQFLIGYWSGDGSKGEGRRTLLKSVSHSLVKGLKELAINLDLSPTRTSRNPSTYMTHPETGALYETRDSYAFGMLKPHLIPNKCKYCGALIKGTKEKYQICMTKKCLAKQKKEYRKKNREVLLKYFEKYNVKNREKRRQQSLDLYYLDTTPYDEFGTPESRTLTNACIRSMIDG